MTRLVLSTVVGLLAGVHPAWAHVTVAPRESRPAISERYTVRVPTEGKVATVEVELEIPEGVTISPQASTGWTHTLKRTGDRATSIVWTTDIKPGEFAEFGFIGRNPKTAKSIVWRAHQRYADGTASHWVGAICPIADTTRNRALVLAASSVSFVAGEPSMIVVSTIAPRRPARSARACSFFCRFCRKSPINSTDGSL